MILPTIESALKAGDLDSALQETKQCIRKEPGDVNLRTLLFHILLIRGEYEPALSQLSVVHELGGRESPFPVVYRSALLGEVERREVFQGKKSATIFGEPPTWMPLQAQLVRHICDGAWEAAEQCQEQVQATVTLPNAVVDGVAVDWIQDADSRLGPVFEAIMKETYYWIPQNRLKSLHFHPPETLRDFVWARAEAEFTNGGRAHLFVPTRYPVGPTTTAAAKMARVSDWESSVGEILLGSGQRNFLNEQGDSHALLDVRSITFASPDEPEPDSDSPA